MGTEYMRVYVSYLTKCMCNKKRCFAEEAQFFFRKL